MVKKNIALSIFFVMIIGLFTGCSNQLESRIKNDYLIYLHSKGQIEVTQDDVKILENYGNFDGSVVVLMDRGSYEVITKIQVGGVDFTFNNTNTAIVWHDGQFYELADAYDEGLLSDDGLNSLAKKINK